MFIAVPKQLRNMMEDVSPEHWRIQAVLFCYNLKKILLINTYFPVDQRNNQDDDDLIITLQCIRGVMDNNDYDTLLWSGDLNMDLKRNSRHVEMTKDFIEENFLDFAWNSYEVDFTHYNEVNGISHVSTIDHFLWDLKLRNNIIDCGVVHHPSNLSDHSPIFCKMNLDLSFEAFPEEKNVKPCPKPSWRRSTDSEKLSYKEELHYLLSDISIPEDLHECRNVHCHNPNHISKIDDLVTSVLHSVDRAAWNNLSRPVTGSGTKQKKAIPGWSHLVQPFKEKSLFWHNVWLSAGRPLNTELHNVMKHARNLYHYQLRKCRKNENIIRKNNLLNSCINGNGNILEEIKKCRKSAQISPSSIDGNSVNIENHFRRTYEALYNCTDDRENVKQLREEVELKLNRSDVGDVLKVTPKILKAASEKLKNEKSDPVFLFSSDCFKHAPDILYEQLCVIIRSFLIHGHVSTFLLIATLVPIIKNKLGNVSSSKNYRSIAISSLVLKLLDWVTLLLFGTRLGLDDLQYAYQSKASTTMCTWLVIETVGYFLRNGSEVFTCQTDMSKAFDMVQFSLLFRKLLDRGFSRIFLRAFIFIYSFQYANV